MPINKLSSFLFGFEIEMNQSNELFTLEDDENYGNISGEILLTTKGRFALQCTQCQCTYKGFEAYKNHFMDEHMPNPESKPNVGDEAYIYDPDDGIQEDGRVTIKMEIVPLDVEELIEDELPISSLGQTETELENSTTSGNSKKSEMFRNVLKRNPVVRKRTPEDEMKHKCPICGLGFKEKHNMNYHLKRHSNQKDHACPDCEKMFYTRSEVRAHRKFHSSVRAFLCSDCGRSFRTRFQLTDHTKRHKNQRDYKCKFCDKAFFDNETLQSHVRVHTLERPFKCKTCDSTFSRQTALRNHLKLHENKKEYKCNLCDAGFNQQAGLFSHLKITHKAA